MKKTAFQKAAARVTAFAGQGEARKVTRRMRREAMARDRERRELREVTA